MALTRCINNELPNIVTTLPNKVTIFQNGALNCKQDDQNDVRISNLYFTNVKRYSSFQNHISKATKAWKIATMFIVTASVYGV